MNKPTDPRDLAVDLLSRSTCSVRVSSVIEDGHGIISWGWNGVGADGMGEHAEAHSIRRANRKRLNGSTIYVASTRSRNGKPITSKPCLDCQHLIEKWGLKVEWRDRDGVWRAE